jgi:hypothetical protein
VVRRRQALVAALCVLFAAPATAGLRDLLEPPEPKVLYVGTAPGLEPGALVVRDPEHLERALAPLDPPYGGAAIDVDDWSLIRVVGEPRESGCRQTLLRAIQTRKLGRTAVVRLEEQVPEKGCRCVGSPRPPRAWLVSVGRSVRQARVEATEEVIPCRELSGEVVLREPERVYEGSWDGQPGTEIVASEAEYEDLVDRLALGERAPAVDFAEQRLIVVSGQPRQNGCRRTELVEAVIGEDAREARFVIEETFASPGQACPQVYLSPKVFLYRVPASVERAQLTTRERR